MQAKEKKSYVSKIGIHVFPLITVRKGSSVKDKNLREYKGKPLLQIAIEKAVKVFGVCYVSTDSNEYATKAKEWGATGVKMTETIPSGQDVSTQIYDFDEWVGAKQGDFVLLIQCTSPNTSIDTLERLRSMLDCQYIRDDMIVCSVAELRQKISALYAFTENYAFRQVCRDGIAPSTPRQEIPTCYFLTGGFFLFPHKQIVLSPESDSKSVFACAEIYPIFVPESESLDIDRAEDFNL